MTLTVAEATPAALRTVQRIELVVRQRLDGVLHGDRLGRLPGPGSELHDSRSYQPGDDVRRIDWALSARTGQVQVRTTVAERELETWLVVDGSASMDFGTDEWTKRELAIAVVAAYGAMSTSAGCRVGVVVATASGPRALPATTGQAGIRRAMLAVAATPAEPGPADLAAGLDLIRRLGRRPGAVVVVSDLLGPDEWTTSLRGMGASARTEVVEVRDQREDELPSVGLLTVVDPETGRLREVQTANPRLRAAFAAAAARQRDGHRNLVRASGAHHLVVSTDRRWLTDLVRHHLLTRSRSR